MNSVGCKEYNLDGYRVDTEEFKVFLNSIPLGTVLVSVTNNFQILRANKAFHMLVSSAESGNSCVSRSFLQYLDQNDRMVAEVILDELLSSSESSCEFNISLLQSGNKVKPVRVYAVRVEGNSGLIAAVICDNTEQYNLENQLRDYRKRLAIILKMSRDVFFEYDTATKTIAWWSHNYPGIIERDTLDNIPDSLFRLKLIDPAHKKNIIDFFSEIHRGAGKAVCTVKTRFCEEDEFRWFRWSAVKSSSHGTNSIMGMVEEIHAQREAELAVENEQIYQRILLNDATYYYKFNASRNKICEFHSSGLTYPVRPETMSYSEFVAFELGYVPDEYRTEMYRFISRENLLSRSFEGEDELQYEYPRRDFEGEEGWMRLKLHLIYNSATREIEGTAYIKDITEEKKRQKELEEEAQRDSLTGLYNKINTENRIKQILEGGSEKKYHAYMILDMDNFKGINDSYGHHFGDNVLIQAAKTLKSVFRSDDVLGRIGGDEFVVFMKEIDSRGKAEERAVQVCERFSSMFDPSLDITCSIGIAMYPDHGTDNRELYQNADKALYQAKRFGKNMYMVYDPLNSGNRVSDKTLQISKNTSLRERIRYNEQKEQLLFLSDHDVLSGLSNRNAYVSFLNELEKKTLRSLGVVVCDINDLKSYNRRYSYEYGNRIIVEAAELLKKHLGSYHLFHTGADQFCVIFEDESIGIIVERIEEIRKECAEKYEFHMSFGYAWKEGNPAYYMLYDTALTRHASDKLTNYRIHNPDSKSYLMEQMNGLKKELEEGRYIMYLQPKIDVATGRLHGAEALVRKIDRKKGFIPPGRFISVLEENNLISMLDYFMLEEVLKTVRQWQKEKKTELPQISMNLSRKTLIDPMFFQTLETLCRKYADVPLDGIILEITESIGDISIETMRSIGQELSNMGFQIALDDFGSQYTNMATLMTIKFDELKIDKTMVSMIETSPNSIPVMNRIIDLCQELKIRIVAEGVETEDQYRIISDLGVDLIQGYFFSKPLPVSVFEEQYLNHTKEQ